MEVEEAIIAEAARRRHLALAAALVVAQHEEEEEEIPKKRRKWTREWLELRNQNQGVLSLLFDKFRPEDPKAFKNYTRMSEPVLEELLFLIAPAIQKANTVMRESISPQLRLAATLRYLAVGKTYVDLSYSTLIAPNTLSELIPETLKAIVDALEKQVFMYPTEPSEWEAVAKKFSTEWNFPHCVGALDGKHVAFRPYRKDGSFYRNYKGSDSLILMALVDAEYKFLYVDVGRNGRQHDSTVFMTSSLGEKFRSGMLGLPEPCLLPGGSEKLPYVILGDDAFALKENLLKPYPDRNLTHENKIFNYRLSRARRVAENAYGILTNRFQILLNPISLHDADKVELIIYACCVLHNFLLLKKTKWYSCKALENKSTSNLCGLARQGGNRSSESAQSVRNKFMAYFNTVGAVEWQEKSDSKGQY